MASSQYDITVAIVRYKPEVKVSVPVNMVGPAVMSLKDAKDLRDRLDVAIKEFEATEEKPNG